MTPAEEQLPQRVFWFLIVNRLNASRDSKERVVSLSPRTSFARRASQRRNAALQCSSSSVAPHTSRRPGCSILAPTVFDRVGLYSTRHDSATAGSSNACGQDVGI